MVQKWKEDPNLHSCETEKDGYQEKKCLDYDDTYVEEFLNQDPLRDWESIDRCKALWFWSLRKAELDQVEDIKDFKVLDCGTKDGQFVEFLDGSVKESIGIEYSKPYVDYAKAKNRKVIWGDVCRLTDWFDWENHFDFVFSHHLLGLTADYLLALEEMLAVTRPGGWMVTCNDIPGNPRKHYSYIESSKIFNEFIFKSNLKVYHNERWSSDFPREWVLLVKKGDEVNNG